MRPGRPDDLGAMRRLWEHEVLAGMRDAVPPDPMMQRILAGFDWEACSRVEEDASGMRGMVLVMHREADGQSVARIEATVAPGEGDQLMQSLVGWGLGLSRAAGARLAQVWRAAGTAEWLRDAGLEPVRPWWRMDRDMADPLPLVEPVDGYHLVDPAAVPGGAWADVFNRSFADHWRFTPRADENLRAGQAPELSLMVADAAGSYAAITLCQFENLPVDSRPQPVGIVGSVGTLPAHRRRGLANWMVAESLSRLKAAGARTASLYVDGRNENRAADLYEKLGFVVTFDTTVWEATLA